MSKLILFPVVTLATVWVLTQHPIIRALFNQLTSS